MTDLRKAAEQAVVMLRTGLPEYDAMDVLCVLEDALAQPEPFNPDWDRINALEESLREHMAEINRLKAIAQPEQEPVAWIFTPNNELLWPSEVEIGLPIRSSCYLPLFSAPPQRKPLTEDEIELAYREIWRNLSDGFSHTSAEWIEASIRYAEKAHGIGGEE